MQLMVKTLSSFSTSDTKLSSKWHILNIDLFHIILPLLIFHLRTLGFQLYILNKSILCTHRQEIKKCEHFFFVQDMAVSFHDKSIVVARLCRSQWSRVLRRRSAAAGLLRLWVRIPPGARMFVCCECCVLSGRGLCDELITRPEESTDCVASLCVI